MAKYNPRKKRKMSEIFDIIENEWSDSDDEVHTVTVVPPAIVDYITDEEHLEEDDIPMNDNVSAAVEVCGTMEYETRGDIGGTSAEQNEYDCDESNNKERCSTGNINTTSGCYAPTTPKRPKPSSSSKESIKPISDSRYKSLKDFGVPKWKKANNIKYNINHQPETIKDVEKELFEKIKDLTPTQLFYLFFDDSVLDYIVEQTCLYASQKNETSFVFNKTYLKRYLGILLISGYHTLPQIPDYWSTNPTLGIPIVKQALSRNKFREIKRSIHFSDNNNLDRNDKKAKIRPLLDIMNKKFMQFGIWAEDMSIDEQMVPYFGRHSCKMFIRGKPIRFGYKLWCLCSSTGYLFAFSPYSGAEAGYDKNLGLRAQTVIRFAEKVENPCRHRLYFDNFFSSYHLMCLLSERNFCATGTVRSNRIGGAQLKSGKALARGNQYNTIIQKNA